MKEELEHFDYTIEKYNEVIDDTILKIHHLRDLYKYDYDAMLEEKFKLEAYNKSIEKAKHNPYFARIDFKSSKHFDKCYIGKKGVIDYDNNIITVDWRAPISSLYYDSNIGKCEYSAPDGIIKGELLLKRQYTIENGELKNYNDVDIVSNDEILKPYLSANADNRLKNIVSTIQREQNKIIREKIGKNIVVQGVAGSGKTTVALHRIAYLVYNYRDIYKPSDYMVIGPNKFFVHYISNVLPDLDVNGVIQNTLDELFLNYLKEEFVVKNKLDVIKNTDIVASFKVSMEMKSKIDEYMQQLNIIPDRDFMVYNIKIVSNSYIKKLYSEINKKIFKSIKSRIDRLILLIEKHINEKIEKISTTFIQNSINQENIEKFKDSINYHLKKYFTILDKDAKKIYINILSNLKFNTDNINQNIVSIEDIPALIYIQYKLNGSRELDNYKHIVIDEAQDYGVFTFYVLKKIFKNSTFSIYGDLAQSLYPYRSIVKWETLNNVFKEFEILRLNKSYRTTIEIMNEANKINDLLGLDKAIPVIRHGEEIEYSNCDILDLLKRIKSKYKTIAIITKDKNDSDTIYKRLSDTINVQLITKDKISYNNNITILPCYLSKGLEFDCVIVVNEQKYDKNSVLDMKLLYVSKTRALHKLIIIK